MEPRRAGLDFHFGKGNNLFCTGGVCSARSEIKRQAELRACKGHFGEDKGHFGEPAEKWTWGHRLPDQVCCFSWAVFSSCGGRGGIPEVLLHLFVQTQALAGGERWELEINAWPNVSVLGIVVPGQGVALTPGMGQGLAVPGSAKGWVILKPSPYSGLSSHPPSQHKYETPLFVLPLLSSSALI